MFKYIKDIYDVDCYDIIFRGEPNRYLVEPEQVLDELNEVLHRIATSYENSRILRLVFDKKQTADLVYFHNNRFNETNPYKWSQYISNIINQKIDNTMAHI
jgi:hypothetical protein